MFRFTISSAFNSLGWFSRPQVFTFTLAVCPRTVQRYGRRMLQTLCCRPVFASAIVASNALREDLGQAVQGNERNQEALRRQERARLPHPEKLIMFADEAERRPEFVKELPRFLAGIWQVFNQYELAGYVGSQKPAARKQLRRLLYMK